MYVALWFACEALSYDVFVGNLFDAVCAIVASTDAHPYAKGAPMNAMVMVMVIYIAHNV